jgi:predicted DNA-binding protein (MmcQ/YjbR family)
MTRDEVNAFCAGFAGAEVSDPWASLVQGDARHDVWKVGGKIFALIGTQGDGVSLKTASTEEAAFLIEMGRGVKAPYLHRSWIKVDWRRVPEEEVRDRITTSYGIIFASLTKKAQRAISESASG